MAPASGNRTSTSASTSSSSSADDSTVWVPYLSVVCLVAVLLGLVFSFCTHMARVRKRRSNLRDYLEQNIDLKRKRLFGMMRKAATAQKDSRYDLLQQSSSQFDGIWTSQTLGNYANDMSFSYDNSFGKPEVLPRSHGNLEDSDYFYTSSKSFRADLQQTWLNKHPPKASLDFAESSSTPYPPRLAHPVPFPCTVSCNCCYHCCPIRKDDISKIKSSHRKRIDRSSEDYGSPPKKPPHTRHCHSHCHCFHQQHCPLQCWTQCDHNNHHLNDPQGNTLSGQPGDTITCLSESRDQRVPNQSKETPALGKPPRHNEGNPEWNPRLFDKRHSFCTHRAKENISTLQREDSCTSRKHKHPKLKSYKRTRSESRLNERKECPNMDMSNTSSTGTENFPTPSHSNTSSAVEISNQADVTRLNQKEALVQNENRPPIPYPAPSINNAACYSSPDETMAEINLIPEQQQQQQQQQLQQQQQQQQHQSFNSHDNKHKLRLHNSNSFPPQTGRTKRQTSSEGRTNMSYSPEPSDPLDTKPRCKPEMIDESQNNSFIMKELRNLSRDGGERSSTRSSVGKKKSKRKLNLFKSNCLHVSGTGSSPSLSPEEALNVGQWKAKEDSVWSTNVSFTEMCQVVNTQAPAADGTPSSNGRTCQVNSDAEADFLV